MLHPKNIQALDITQSHSSQWYRQLWLPRKSVRLSKWWVALKQLSVERLIIELHMFMCIVHEAKFCGHEMLNCVIHVKITTVP